MKWRTKSRDHGFIGERRNTKAKPASWRRKTRKLLILHCILAVVELNSLKKNYERLKDEGRGNWLRSLESKEAHGTGGRSLSSISSNVPL